ncbi:hypothetical protein C0991_007397 [Blastosporella zonata]|nr:hypothetical protein C0991_007397 [Blastosporella zonata]
MAEQTAGPSTIPVIKISAHGQGFSEEDSASSSSASPTLTALETPTALEPLLSEPPTPEPTQTTNEIPLMLSRKEEDEQIPISPPKPNLPGGSGGGASAHGTTLPRTESGAPVSLKRNKAPSKGTKNAQGTQFDEQAPWYGVVVDYAPPQKEQAVMFPAKMVYSSPNIPYNNESWAFQRATGYSDYIGSGFVFINVNGEKKRKNVKDNTYVFIVLEGVVEVLIHQTSYAVSTGGVFVVPRGLAFYSIANTQSDTCAGNFYTIRNISEKEAKLFFTQTRKPESETTVDTSDVNRPSSKSFILADWLLQHVVARLLRLRVKAFDWYWKNLAKYRHLLTTRRLYFLFFILGLMVRRLPFVGSPPILNIQLVRLTSGGPRQGMSR